MPSPVQRIIPVLSARCTFIVDYWPHRGVASNPRSPRTLLNNRGDRPCARASSPDMGSSSHESWRNPAGARIVRDVETLGDDLVLLSVSPNSGRIMTKQKID